MAELAGLIVGGVGLAALFDSCVQAFEYIDAARNHGVHFQRLILRLSILRLRLSRWGATVRWEDGGSDEASLPTVVVASQSEVAIVRELLGHIFACLEDARTASQRYKSALPGTDNRVDALSNAGVTALVERTRRIALRRQRHSPTAEKARWALHDEKKLRALVEDLTCLVTSLVELFPGTQPAEQELALRDAAELIEPPSAVADDTTEPAEPVVDFLLESVSTADPCLRDAISTIAKLDRGHNYEKVIAIEDARVHSGDFISEGASVGGYGHTYGGIYTAGRARVLNGNRYGGKSVLDD